MARAIGQAPGEVFDSTVQVRPVWGSWVDLNDSPASYPTRGTVSVVPPPSRRPIIGQAIAASEATNFRPMPADINAAAAHNPPARYQARL